MQSDGIKGLISVDTAACPPLLQVACAKVAESARRAMVKNCILIEEYKQSGSKVRRDKIGMLS